MTKTIFLAFSISILLTACSNSDDTCEDITLASEQIRECQNLHKQIINAKGEIIKRTELERRYQADCIDVRYYRNDRQLAKCGNKHKIEEFQEAVKEEAKH